MKKIKYIAPVLALFTVMACGPLDQMQSELDGQKTDLEEIRESPEEWDEFVKGLDTKKGTLSKMSKQIKDLEELIDSMKGGEVIEYALVAASPVKLETFKSYVKVHGVVSTDKSINVVPEGMGIVRKVMVKRGSRVRAGQALAYLDTQLMTKNIKELETSLSFANTLFQKQKSLYDQNVGTELQYLEAKNRKESLEQSLATLKTQRAKSTITAPVSGTIDELFLQKGEMAAQGMPFARIVNTSNVYADADVSEKFISKINVGDEVLVEFPYSNKEIPVKVTYKSNYINPNNRTFKVHASLAGLKEKFVPNMLTVLRLRDSYAENSVVINNTAISTDIKGDFVFTLKKSGEKYEVVKTPIERGTTFENESLILSGLKANDMLVTERYQTLAEGDLVEVKK